METKTVWGTRRCIAAASSAQLLCGCLVLDAFSFFIGWFRVFSRTGVFCFIVEEKQMDRKRLQANVRMLPWGEGARISPRNPRLNHCTHAETPGILRFAPQAVQRSLGWYYSQACPPLLLLLLLQGGKILHAHLLFQRVLPMDRQIPVDLLLPLLLQNLQVNRAHRIYR